MFFKTGVRVCGDDHKGKGKNNLGGDDSGTSKQSDRDKTDNSGTSRQLEGDREAKNLGTSTPNIDKVDNLGICTSDTNKDGGVGNSGGGTDDPGIGRQPDEDGKAKDLGIDVPDADGADDLGTHILDADKDGGADNPGGKADNPDISR